jgi:hypothetical protein
MIRKTSGGYEVLSEKTGKSLGGPYKTRAEAQKRKSDFAKWSFLSIGRAKRSCSVSTMNIRGDAATSAAPLFIHRTATAAVLKVRNAAFPRALN